MWIVYKQRCRCSLYFFRKSAQCMSWSAKYKEDVERRISIFKIFVIQLRFSYIWMTDLKSIYYITKQLISAWHCCKNSAINNRNHRSRSLETVIYESNLVYIFTSSSCIQRYSLLVCLEPIYILLCMLL